MSIINSFFESISVFDYVYDKHTATELSFGKNITINTGTKLDYNIADFDILIFSVEINETAKQIRKELYSLSFFDKKIKILDLGNLITNAESKVNYTLREALLEIKESVKSIIIIGENASLLNGIYNVYEFKDKLVNITEISSKINFVKPESDTSEYDLSKILLDKKHKLFHYLNIGYQTHYNNIKTIDLLNENGFEAHRFGNIKAKIKQNEYLLRDADIVSIDMSAVSHIHASNVISPSPNGFSAYDICQLAYYAGISDNSEIFSIFGLLKNTEEETITTKLTAQIIWYYISGFINRYNDNPYTEKQKYKKISVAISKNETNIVFYTNTVNNRWWFEVEFKNTNLLVSCSEQDYKETLNGNIPLRWILFDNKN